jgi:wingless-type MMTV integration site family protein 4
MFFKKGMRESAYIYALSSAALAYQITSDCTSGLLSDCSCYDSKQGIGPDGNKWSG